MSQESRLRIPVMKYGSLLLSALLFGTSVSCLAFTLDIASNQVTEFGQGPLLIFVPGYGEVVFESGLDGALVVDSAYASTGKMDAPPASASASEAPVAATEDAAGYVKIASRASASTADQPATGTDGVAAMKNPPDGGDSVPETASAALGLLGILLFLLRRWR